MSIKDGPATPVGIYCRISDDREGQELAATRQDADRRWSTGSTGPWG
jgi:hypothetical protein